MNLTAARGRTRNANPGTEGRQTVCHVFSGDLWAGAEVVIFNLLSCLHQDPSLRVLALSLNEGALVERLRAEGVATHVIPEAQYSIVGVLRRAVRLLGNERITIFHSHRYKENLIAWSLAKWLGVANVVSTVHGVSEATTNDAVEQCFALLRRRLDYSLLKGSFSTVAVSEDMKRVLVKQYGFREDRIEVIRNGGRFPTPRPHNSLPGRYFHIGTVGRMVPVKGLDLFLEIGAAIACQMPNVQLSILGDGPLRTQLELKASALGIRDKVKFLAPTPDVFSYYGSLDLYLNTSVHEGLPLSVVEALASGTPVISAAVGGIPEIIEDGQHGYLVRGRDPNVFAKHCLELMRHEFLRRAMGERASAMAHAHLSAPAMAAAYRRLYRAMSIHD